MAVRYIGVFVFVSVGLAGGCGKDSPDELVYTEEREACTNRNSERNLYFGDLHAHTALSFDAWAYGVRTTPQEAYRFAQGDPLELPSAEGTRTVRLEQALDFAALSDHMEFLGEVSLCTREGSSAYETSTCQDYRKGDEGNVVAFGMTLAATEAERFADVCGDGDTACLDEASLVWQGLQEAAEEAYDRTRTCSFTSFVAYEYTNTVNVTNLHRNVIFRHARVPALPPSYFEKPSVVSLWLELVSSCLEAGDGCDVIVVPHNSNWSNGRLFHPDPPASSEIRSQQEYQALRARMEPLVEAFQHKGDMECENHLAGLGGDPDPLCDFEKQRQPPLDDCGEEPGSGGVSLFGCVHTLDFTRNVFKAGLVEQSRLGFNPYMLGTIGSTDTHNGTPGLVEEIGFGGHVGTTDDKAQKRLGPGNMTHHGVRYNPGGLAAVWAVENSRDALFEAFRRREVYGTSGPRIAVRFFGAWDLPAGTCDAADRVEKGYRKGVPMGGILPERPSNAQAPVFVVWASADSANTLQRIQIVKGWLGPDRRTFERVIHVAGDEDTQDSLDLATCEPGGSGHQDLCATWQDPDFNPGKPAYYYARVLEIPTCRWSVRQCNQLADEQRPVSCTDPVYFRSIQERAWTSPIWYKSTPHSR